MEPLSIDWSNLASIVHIFTHLKHAMSMVFVRIHLHKSFSLNIQNRSTEAPIKCNGNPYTVKIKKRNVLSSKPVQYPIMNGSDF
jgi:hypothetical protein